MDSSVCVCFSFSLSLSGTTGFYRRSMNPQGAGSAAIGAANKHVYKSRAGLFDVDYIGHMNNAAYLTHAEYARWEMTAQNGMLQTVASNGFFFIVSGTFIRYRRDIRPIFQSFQVDTFVSGVDERNIWISHNFRLSEEDRVRAQLMVQAVVLQKGKVVDPRHFLVQDCGFDADLVGSVTLPDGAQVNQKDILDQYLELDDAMRTAAAIDDARPREK